MTDLPDWTTQQQAGGIRYVGSISVTIGGGGTGGGSLNVTLLPLDRSIIVVCPGRGAITTTTVDVLTNDPGVSPALFSTSAGVSAAPQPVNAYVSPAITSAWQVAVDMTGPPAGPYVFYVFVDSSVTHVAVDPGAASIPVGITSPAFGQANALNSLPVVLASDQSIAPLVTSQISDSRTNVAAGTYSPGGGTLGTGAARRIIAYSLGVFVRGTTLGATIATVELLLQDAHGHAHIVTAVEVGSGTSVVSQGSYPVPITPSQLVAGDTWTYITNVVSRLGTVAVDFESTITVG